MSKICTSTIAFAITAIVVYSVFIVRNSETKQKYSPQVPPKASINLPVFTSDFAVPVLMYHRVQKLTPSEAKSPLIRDLTVDPDDFDAQMKYLRDNGFVIISALQVQDAVRNHTTLPEKAVALTMDDGYKDNFEVAFPILQQYGYPATVFLVTSMVGANNHVSWDDCRRLLAGSTRLESHTVHHYDLTSLSRTVLNDELQSSKQAIENMLNTKVTSIAYPSGSYNDTVVAALPNLGYEAGWKKGGGPVMPGDNPYMLPRIRVHGRTDISDFIRKVNSGIACRKLGIAKATL